MPAPLSTPPAGRPHVVAVFVDAAYLLTAASALLFDEESRRGIKVKDPALLIGELARRALDHTPGQLLRTYWFDAAPRRVHTVAQREIAVVPHVKVRLGNQNRQGAQKGVDHLLRMEMERLAANRAITDGVLLTGDEDLLPAVEAAQAYGVTVHLWGVEPRFGSNQAENLVWEADTVGQLDREFLEPLFTFVPKVETVRSAPPDALEALVAAARAEGHGPGLEEVLEAANLDAAGLDGSQGAATGLAGAGLVATGLAAVPSEPEPDAADDVPAAGPAPGAPVQPEEPARPPTPAEIAARLGVAGVKRPARPTGVPAAVVRFPAAAAPPPAPVRLVRPPEEARPVASTQPLYSTSTGQRGRFGLTDLQVVLFDVGATIARRWLHSRGRENLADLLPHRPTLPGVIDVDLLVEAEKDVGYSLRHAVEDRTVLRDGFWSVLEQEYGLSS